MERITESDLPRTTLQLLFLGVLIASSCWILSPFLTAGSWAATIVVATWPILLHIQAWLGNRRSLAVAVMTLALLLILLVPLYFGVSAIVGNAERIPQWSKSLTTLAIPQPPSWLEGLPGIGEPIAARWREIASLGPEDISAHLAPYARATIVWFVAQVGNVGMLFLQFLLTVIIAAILYANGETATRGIDRFAVRLAGARGKNAVHLAAQAVRAVALGVVLTAGIQSALCGIGLAVAGVPFAVILTAAMFMLGVAQIGPMPILIPTIVWVYWAEGTAWGTGFLIWAVFCGVIDNVIRPLLIKRGAHLPLLLIFGGVIGGLIAIGVIGLFIGPVVLAVAYTLLADWVSAVDQAPQPV
jgi:predicted PurR-regulated permease PerM